MPGSLTLHTPLRLVRGIGPTRARVLLDAGYTTVLDLLYHLPSRYEDCREVTPIAVAIQAGEGSYTLSTGLPAFRIADMRRDLEWLERARDDAREFLPQLLVSVGPRALARHPRLGGG